MIRVTTQSGIHTTVHLISRIYRRDNLYLCRKYISGIWYVDWMPAITKSITKYKCAFVYYYGTLPEVYPKESNKSMHAAETLKELFKNVGITENPKSDR